MGRYRKINERLDGLERRARDHDDELRRGAGRGNRDGRGDHGGHGGEHDEKRIIDTIVRLVGERVGEMLQGRDGERDHRQGRDGHDDWRDEKRKIDFVVDLVGERVEEIVARELDRRLGPASADAPPAGGGEVARRSGARRRKPEAR